MKSRLLYYLLTLVVAASCTDGEQPSDSRARVLLQEDSLVSQAWIHATLEDGVSLWSFAPGDFTMSPTDSSLFLSPEVQTRANGTLQVKFRLVTGGGSLFSDGAFALPLSPNWRWSLEVVHAVDDPITSCGDCLGTAQFKIYDSAHAQEWIWVIWRGRGP